MASTLAGNLTVTGSVANIIVVEGTREVAPISFGQYFRVGLPITALTTLLGWLWLSRIREARPRSPFVLVLGENRRMTPADRTHWVVQQARGLGFDLCGVAPVGELDELKRLPEWLARGYAGEMDYLNDPRRNSPAQVLRGARSVIVCALNYNTPSPYSTEIPANVDPGSPRGPGGWISRYAWGDDYHEVLGQKLESLLQAMREQFGESLEARVYVDTGPVVERVAAKYAGLGWLAKNTCLIHPELGSWLFLGVIVTTLELAASLGAQALPPDLCGNCRLCIDACPTGAIVEPYVLDARRCISYLTIELRGSIAEKLRAPMGRMVFGCDICQDVCPWNRNAPVTSVAAFLPRAAHRKPVGVQHPAPLSISPEPAARNENSLFAPKLEWLASLSEEEFRQVFRRSAVKRAKWRGLVRNACVALGNSGACPGTPVHARIVALLERLAGSGDAIIAEHARWALARLRSA